MAADWFRNDSWTPADQTEFERRLARATARKRPSYVRIQGVHLLRAGNEDAARELWLRVLDLVAVGDVQGGGERASALELLADSYVGSDPLRAESWYRQLLAEYPTLHGSSGRADLSLAEVLVAQGNSTSARDALAAWTDRRALHTPEDLLRTHIVLVDIAEAEGDQRAAREAARQALATVPLPSPYANHPQLGLARLDPATRERLTRLARRGWFRR